MEALNLVRFELILLHKTQSSLLESVVSCQYCLLGITDSLEGFHQSFIVPQCRHDYSLQSSASKKDN